MAATIANIAKGRFVEFQRRVIDNDPATAAFVVVLLQDAQANATLADHNTLADLLANVNNTEADFTNYARVLLTDADVTEPVLDDVNERVSVDLPDVTIADAGGAVNNALEKALVCFAADPGAGDASIIPAGIFDVDVTTLGNDLVIEFNLAGWARAN